MGSKTPFADRSSNNSSSAPTVNDDELAGWDIGSRWINTATNTVYFAVSVTAGAAVWKDVSTPGAGSHPVTTDVGDPDANDDANAGFSVGDHWINTTDHRIWQAVDVSIGAAVWDRVDQPKLTISASDPTTGDDNTLGYEIGSTWINTSTDKVFDAVDVTTAAAVWVTSKHPVTSNASDPDANDDGVSGFIVGDHWVNTTTNEVFQLTDASTGAAIWQLLSRRPVWDAIVAPSGGDYTLPSAAFTAGHKNVWMRSGTYLETTDVVIPDGGHLAAETGSLIDFNGGAFQVVADGNGGVKETAGTFGVTNGSTAIVGTGTTFTNLSPGDWIFVSHAAYQIDTITDNTNLDLVDPWCGPTQAGLPTLASSMYSEIILQDFDIRGSTDTSGGLYLRGCRHGMIRNVDVENCTHNIIIEECESISTDNLISYASANDGVKVLFSFNLRFDRSRSYGNSGNGLTINNGGFHRYDSSEVSGNGLAGFRVENSATDVGLNGCVIEENSGSGVESVSGTQRIQIYGAEIERNGSHGVDLAGSENSVTSTEVVSNTGYGVAIGEGGLVIGSHIDSNGSHGVSLSGASNSVVATNDIHSNGGDGVILASSDDVTLASNRIRLNTGSGIAVPSTGVSRTRLLGNNTSGNGTDFSIAAGTGGDTTIFSAEYTGTDLTGPVLHNTSGLTPPTPADDRTLGYQKGSLWLDTVEKDVYICVDSTTSTALWVQINFQANQTRDTPRESFYGSLLDYPVSAGNTAGEIQYVRIWFQAQFEFAEMRCFVDAGGTAARDVRMGIYDQADPEDPTLPPRNLVASTLASNTTGANGAFKTEPLQVSYTVPTTGYYWLAIVQDSASLKLASSATFRADFLPVYRESGSGTNLPATAGTLSNPVSALVYISAVEV